MSDGRFYKFIILLGIGSDFYKYSIECIKKYELYEFCEFHNFLIDLGFFVNGVPYFSDRRPVSGCTKSVHMRANSFGEVCQQATDYDRIVGKVEDHDRDFEGKTDRASTKSRGEYKSEYTCFLFHDTKSTFHNCVSIYFSRQWNGFPNSPSNCIQ